MSRFLSKIIINYRYNLHYTHHINVNIITNFYLQNNKNCKYIIHIKEHSGRYIFTYWLLDLERISLNFIGSFVASNSFAGVNGKTSFSLLILTLIDSTSSTEKYIYYIFF